MFRSLRVAAFMGSALAMQPPDLVLHGGSIILLDGRGDRVDRSSAVAVRGDRIAFVGTDAEALALAGPATRKVDLAGRFVIPGLTDAHGHVSGLGFALTRVDAVGTKSAADVASAVRRAAQSAPQGAWIQGRGWDQNDWESSGFPTRKILDEAAPSHPVALERVDGHALWVNSRALQAASIDRKTPDPDGGRIIRDGDGNPTGILVDNATNLVESKIPAPDRAQVKAAIVRALDHCLDYGLTEVHDAGISREDAAIYRELARSGELPIRVYAMLGGTSRALGDYFAEPPLVGFGGGFLTIRAIKLAIDGALGSRGAALFDDYSDEPGRNGLITRPPEEIRSLAEQAISRGYQVCVHAIGDRGNALVLDALEAALKSAPPGDYRPRIEHAQILRIEDIPRFAAGGIIASMQPTHCTSDMPWAEARVGPKRVKGAYAWTSLRNAGARLAFGSDFPVESDNPFLGLYAAVTRQDAEGKPPAGWYPAERLTARQALHAFTAGAAYAAFEERERGALVAGFKADVVILRDDPTKADGPARLLSMRPDAVILDGRVVRVSKEWAADLPLSPARNVH
jgi:predicted amidohydrolase YtcJ